MPELWSPHHPRWNGMEWAERQDSARMAAIRQLDRLREEHDFLVDSQRHWRELAEAGNAQVERLCEAMAAAITSLETGPMTDGYAAHVLREALTPALGRER